MANELARETHVSRSVLSCRCLPLCRDSRSWINSMLYLRIYFIALIFGAFSSLLSSYRDLVADVTLDERHPRRLVKCVTWQPPPSSKGASRGHQGNVSRSINGRSEPSRGRSNIRDQQQPPPPPPSRSGHSHHGFRPTEKFALKITMRGPKDVHCKRVFTEKDIMLALEPSPWHIKLVVNSTSLFALPLFLYYLLLSGFLNNLSIYCSSYSKFFFNEYILFHLFISPPVNLQDGSQPVHAAAVRAQFVGGLED